MRVVDFVTFTWPIPAISRIGFVEANNKTHFRPIVKSSKCYYVKKMKIK